MWSHLEHRSAQRRIINTLAVFQIDIFFKISREGCRIITKNYTKTLQKRDCDREQQRPRRTNEVAKGNRKSSNDHFVREKMFN